MEYFYLVFVTIGILSVIPNFKLIKYYKQTKINEFILFAMMFFSASSFFIFIVLASNFGSLWLWKITAILLNVTYYLILLHALRLIWHKIPRYLTVLATIWITILVVIIFFFWQIIPVQNSANVLFFRMSPNELLIGAFNYDIGYKLSNGTMIYSYQYNLISLVFMFTAAFINILGYFTVKVIRIDDTVMKVQKLMRTSAVTLVIALIFSLFKFQLAQYISLIFLVLTFIIINYVSYRHPTVLLITHAQIIRAMQTYDEIEDITKLNDQKYQDEMILYLNRISSILSES